jgi:hypothetical protein
MRLIRIALFIAVGLFSLHLFADDECLRLLSAKYGHSAQAVYTLREAIKPAGARNGSAIADFKNNPKNPRTVVLSDALFTSEKDWDDAVRDVRETILHARIDELQKIFNKYDPTLSVPLIWKDEDGNRIEASPSRSHTLREWAKTTDRIEIINLIKSNPELSARTRSKLKYFQTQVALLRKGDTVIFQPKTIVFAISLEEEVREPWLKIAEQNAAILKRLDPNYLEVQFPEKRFVLGEYLGSGNTVSIFALANDPNKAIRIALSAGGVDSWPGWDHGTSRLANKMLRNPSARDTKIYDVRLGYSVTDRVYGELSSDRFLYELKEKFGDQLMSELLKELNTVNDSKNAMMLLKLIQAMRDVGLVTPDGIENDFHQYQCVYDTRKQDWVNVDRE